MTMASLKCKFKLFRDPLFCGSLLWIKTLGFADVRHHFQLRITGFLNRGHTPFFEVARADLCSNTLRDKSTFFTGGAGAMRGGCH